jgi:3D (Asp-Asp-Asp) domain-containing protein
LPKTSGVNPVENPSAGSLRSLGNFLKNRLPLVAPTAIEGETLMPRCLNLAFAGALSCFVVGCATQSKPTLTSGRRIPKVRTTAYTHHEGGSGAHNAIGTYLSGRQVLSAASDWSRYPLGTRFRLVDTSEEYVIDDYGGALVGTDTIDLYKPTRSEVGKWGVRYVDIDILQWGSEEESLKVLAPRCKHSCVKKMVVALEKKKGKTVAQNSAARTGSN